MSADKLQIRNNNTVIIDSAQGINFSADFSVSESPAGTALISFAGSSSLNQKLDGYGFFGTGVDGNVTISTNTTLTRDMNYNVLTINAGVVLSTGGFRIFAWDIAGAGTISDKGVAGGNATALLGGVAGTARGAGYLPAPTTGRNGGAVDANGVSNTGAANSIGASGISGKNSATKTGGTGGTVTALTATYGGMRGYTNLQLWRAFGASDFVVPIGNMGNGGSAGGSTGGGGASGNNGGYAMVFARTISGTITIDCSGGVGGNGFGNGANGVGGNGGIIGFVYHSVTGTITLLYTGGVGGTGGSGSAQGDTGVTGILISLQI